MTLKYLNIETVVISSTFKKPNTKKRSLDKLASNNKAQKLQAVKTK